MSRFNLRTNEISHRQNERCYTFRIAACLSRTSQGSMPLAALILLIQIFLSGCGGSSKPVSVSVSPTSTVLDGGNSTLITASVTNDRDAAGVTWALTGAGALSNQTKSSVTYTAPPPSTSSASASITATSGADTSKAARVTISIPAKPMITTVSLAVGNVGSTYSEQLNATGGIPPYLWTVSKGTIPSCIEMSSSGALLSIGSLMASCAGTNDLEFKVTDSGKPTALTATATLGLVVQPAPAITFTGSMPSTATTGAAYIGSAAATGGVGGLLHTIESGTLPPGLLLNDRTGMISGLPRAKGSFIFTIKAADSYGDVGRHDFQITVMDPLALDDRNLSTIATINAAFSGAVIASGGTGNYSWQVTGLPTSGLAGSVLGDTLTVSGTPTSVSTLKFSVEVTDTSTKAVVNQAYSIEIGNPTPVGLSSVNPPAATVNQPYAAVIVASGGVGPYSWSINGAAVSTGGLSISNGLRASNAGSNKLSIAGNPTTTDSVILNSVRVADTLNTHATQTYTVVINEAGAQVGGWVRMRSNCGTSGEPLPPITVSINTPQPRQTLTTPEGYFTFENVPDGKYTVTPSTGGPPAEPVSVFYPTSAQITVADRTLIGVLEFTAMLGYTVSGSVAYQGLLKGQTYINLIDNCNNIIGTSISQNILAAGGVFTIHGVGPGEYWIIAAMDPSTLGNGAGNDADPIGYLSSPVEVSTANIGGISIEMADGYSEIFMPPALRGISPTRSGVVISFDGSSVIDWWTGWESWSSYTVQWSTDKSFTEPSPAATFKAVGTGYPAWVLNNGNDGMTGSMNPGTAYYFRVRGTNAAGNSDWAYWGGPNKSCQTSSCAVSVTAGEPSGDAYAIVTGGVSITSEMASIITGPLYVGYLDPNTGLAYGHIISDPIIGENAYSIPVLKSPTTGYIPFGILDQNKNGLVDVGDVTNITDDPPATIINGNTTGLIELSYLYDLTRVQTHYLQDNFGGMGGAESQESYSLRFYNIPAKKLPVSVQLIGGPNVVVPLDLGNCPNGCGSAEFSNKVALPTGARPALGDTYTFHVTFSDGTSWDEYAQVTAFGGTSSIAGPESVPTNLAPSSHAAGQTTPTFTWTYPNLQNQTPNPMLYQFWISSSDTGTVWRIPKYNSVVDGFTAVQIPGSLVWGVDPTDTNNKPSPATLTTGRTYTWQIQAQDDLGNISAAQRWFIP